MEPAPKKVEQKEKAPANGKKPDASKQTKRPTLAYGTIKFKAVLSHGKFRFINQAQQEKLLKKKTEKAKAEGKELPEKPKKKPNVIVKPIKGEKNGGTRTVHKKRKNFYPAEKKPRKHLSRGCYKKHKRHFRSSLAPGAVLILLAGVNKGKRVVLLKCLESGLLLVTGPFKLNGVPLRRVQPCHVIATKTKLDLSDVKLPEKVTDTLFRRNPDKKKVTKGEKTVFISKKKVYKPNTERKAIQKEVDSQVLAVIKKNPERKALYAYLATMFGLRNNQYPHRMQF